VQSTSPPHADSPAVLVRPKGHSSNADHDRRRLDRELTPVDSEDFQPEPDDQKRHRDRRGSRGSRPPGFDVSRYKRRNVVKRGFNNTKQWRGLVTRYDRLALVYRAAAVLRAVTLRPKGCETRPSSPGRPPKIERAGPAA
jgi:hypothetical protein